MKKLNLISLAMLLLMLCGCSGGGIMDTYWRDDKTGDWLIGLTEDRVIYDCKVWDIASKNESDGAYSILVENGADKLDISIGTENDGKRTISIDGKTFDCSLISGGCLPDYPEKDTCTTLADNHYQEGDSVTVIGWVKPKKGLFGGFESKANGKEITAFLTANVLTGENPTYSVPIDTLGQFKLRIPIENTTSFCLKIGQDSPDIAATVVAEPNETYFMMKDYDQGKTLFMGKNVRLLNEIEAHHIITSIYGATKQEKIGNIMNILDSIKNNTKATLKELDDVCREHPTFSERYRTYTRNYILAQNAYFLMQGMYLQPNYELPEEYIKVVDEEYWKEFDDPYTMSAYEFSHFLNDYGYYLWTKASDKDDHRMKNVLETAEKDGLVKLTPEDRQAIRQYDEAYLAYWEKSKNTPDSLREAVDEEFGRNDFVKSILEIQARIPNYDDYSQQKFLKSGTELMMKDMEARGMSETARDIIICCHLCSNINWARKPLGKEILDFADEHIHTLAARNAVHAFNDKYEQLSQSKLSNDENIKSNDAVKDMTDGEKILRKIIEPYKGKIILLDIWGTWCGPCKQRLQHSQEEYERLKDFEIVYLYLANRSSDESWKNVIKEYKIEGDNVIHYNLPAEQQSAVESFIGINGYPTYKLIDRNGTMLDVNADPIDLDALAGLLERIK